MFILGPSLTFDSFRLAHLISAVCDGLRIWTDTGGSVCLVPEQNVSGSMFTCRTFGGNQGMVGIRHGALACWAVNCVFIS